MIVNMSRLKLNSTLHFFSSRDGEKYIWVFCTTNAILQCLEISLMEALRTAQKRSVSAVEHKFRELLYKSNIYFTNGLLRQKIYVD